MKVEQKHARILRECLARVHKVSPPHIQLAITKSMSEYAKAICEYCEHVEEVVVDGKFACLDCCERRTEEERNAALAAKEKEENGEARETAKA